MVPALLSIVLWTLRFGNVHAWCSQSTSSGGPMAFQYQNPKDYRCGGKSIVPQSWKPVQRRTFLRSSRDYVTTDSNSNQNSNDSFMASLQSRLQEVNDRETILPFIILDSILPRQLLNVTIPTNTLFLELIRSRIANETPYFGMLGNSLETGVRVDIIGKPKKILEVDGTTSVQILLKGSSKQFRILGEVKTVPPGLMEGRVEYFQAVDDESESLLNCVSKAQSIPKLVQEWIALARTKEQRQGQMNDLLYDLGTMPTPEEPTDLSLWVGALINPSPALGVASEIRPALLNANTAEERVEIVLEAIQKSIRHMQGEPLQS